jgi:hypothetical protein
VRARPLLAALLLAALLACGCSRLSIGWRLAPLWLRHEAAAWLGAASDERAALDRDVDAYLRSLSLQVAPRAAAWSRHLAKEVAASQDKAAVDSLFNDGLALWRAIKEPGVAPAADWLSRRPLQRAQALKKGFDQQAGREAGFEAGAKAAEARAKRLKEWLQDWVGDLSGEQEDRIRAFTDRADYPTARVEADRRRREQALLATLAGTARREELESQLRRWWLDLDMDRDRATEQAVQAYRGGLRGLLTDLLDSLTPVQRDRLARRLTALAEDLDAIYRRAVTQGP